MSETETNRLELLQDAIKNHGSQAKVGRMLGYSNTTVSQVLSGIYPGSVEKFLVRVEEVFGTRTMVCPILGDINIIQCVKERRAPFSTANPTRVKLYRTCSNCEFNTDSVKI